MSSRRSARADRARSTTSAKPDIVAPGVAIESMAEPSSALFAANPSSRLWGTVERRSEPYLSLTGTSMAAPVVTGAVALMLQANPALTPNAVKAILQYTAEARDGYDHLTQGAGFLNARGAVELSRAFAGIAHARRELIDDPMRWSRHIIWGNRRIGGGMLDAARERVGAGRDMGRRPDGSRRRRSAGACHAAANGACGDSPTVHRCRAGVGRLRRSRGWPHTTVGVRR